MRLTAVFAGAWHPAGVAEHCFSTVGNFVYPQSFSEVTQMLDKIRSKLTTLMIQGSVMVPGQTAERGSGLAEFALILALVVVVAIAALQGLGSDITSILDQVRAAL